MAVSIEYKNSHNWYMCELIQLAQKLFVIIYKVCKYSFGLRLSSSASNLLAESSAQAQWKDLCSKIPSVVITLALSKQHQIPIKDKWVRDIVWNKLKHMEMHAMWYDLLLKIGKIKSVCWKSW